MNRGAWQATINAVTKSRTQLSDYHFHFHMKAISMVTHTVHFIRVTHLFWNWKLVALKVPHLFIPYPPNRLFILYIFKSVSALLCLLICIVF